MALLRGLEALPAPEQVVAPESAETPRISVLIPVHNHWAITLNALRSLRSAPLVKPATASDQRRRMAVLLDLETVCSGTSLAADR